MQQQMQLNDLILPDVYTLRDTAVRKVKSSSKRDIKVSSVTENVSSPQSSRNTVNQFIPTLRRDKETMRAEIVLCAEKFFTGAIGHRIGSNSQVNASIAKK